MATSPVTNASSGEKLLSKLHGQGRGSQTLMWLLGAFTVTIIFCNLYFSLLSRSSRVELSLSAPVTEWEHDYLLRVEELHASIEKRGSIFEQLVFTSVVNLLNESVHATAVATGTESISLGTRFWVGVHYAIMNVFYLFFWWFRFWLLFVVGSCVWMFYNFKPYTDPDFLGQMGNGRMYFSGLRARLGKVSRRGAPEFQVRGVTCLPEVSAKEAEESTLVRSLESFGAKNETTFALARMLLADPSIPAYVGERGVSEEAIAQNDVPSLIKHVTQVVGVALEVHRALKTGNHYCLDLDDDAKFLRKGFRRVLTRKLTKALSNITSAEIATAILAFEAGKIMTFEKEAGYWLRRSQFPQLNGRAILHSVASYAQEFQADQRDLIRQSLIFSERNGIHAPVQFPVGLSEEVLALRQWIELLWSLPFGLEEGADATEAFGIIYEINRSWILHTVKAVAQGETFFVSGSYIGHDDLLFVPFSNVLTLLSRITEREAVERLSTLIEKRQKQVAADEGKLPDGVTPCSLADLRLLPEKVSKSLTKEMGIPEGDVTQWSVLRNVLQYFSWLGFRVGDRTVPDGSVITCTVKLVDAFDVSSEPQFLQADKLVPLRGGRIKEVVGSAWEENIPHVLSLVMVGGEPLPASSPKSDSGLVDESQMTAVG